MVGIVVHAHNDTLLVFPEKRLVFRPCDIVSVLFGVVRCCSLLLTRQNVSIERSGRNARRFLQRTTFFTVLKTFHIKFLYRQTIMPVDPTFDDVQQQNRPPSGLPASVTSRCDGQWRLQGTGLFRWSVFRVYESSLFVQKPLTADAIANEFDDLSAFALVLNYLRNVSAAQIASTSVSEMIRLQTVDPIVAAQWGQQMATMLPDVGLGDKLVGLFEPGHGVSFFSNENFLGQVLDASFASAFAAVWLDPNTKAPALRTSLLGLQSERLS